MTIPISLYIWLLTSQGPLRKAHASRLARGRYAAEVAVAVRLAVDCGKAMRDPRSRWGLIPGKSKNVNGG